MKNKNKNKGGFLFLLLFLLLAGFFGFSSDSSAAENCLIITEIMYDPEGTNTGHSDWIELYNPTDASILILEKDFGIIEEESLVFSEKTHRYLNCHGINKSLEVAAKKFIILADNETNFKNDYPGVTTPVLDTTLDLSLNGDGIHLSTDNCATFFTEVFYENSWGAKDNGKTLEKINFSAENRETNWQETYDYEHHGTPGKESSKEPPQKIYSEKITINEILPNPEGSDSDLEFMEFYNSGETTEDLDGWKLKDNNGKSHSLEGNTDAGLEIGPTDYLVINSNDYGVSLHNSADEKITLLNPSGKEISKVAYEDGEVKENISYNFDGKDWHWSRFLTPGKENKFNNPPEVSKKKDNKIYVGIYADFSAKGHDKDKDKLKFTWDFGDGHKSYKKETRHKYTKTGKYKVTLKVSDGSEDKIETFNIKVKKFPKSKVKIVSVSPNPSGKDSDTEFITLQNKSKKKINLKDWSVATGSKKLYNHPVSKDIFIKPGEILKLTRDFSKFTLNNSKAKVELRYPNGKVVSKLAYDKKKKSVSEDEIYTKESGRWAWVAPKTEARLAIAEKPDPIEVSPQVEERPIILAASGQNFSEDKNLRKNVLDNFARPQGIVLGAATFKPTFSGNYPAQNKGSYLEIIFIKLNFSANYFLNKLSFFFN